MAGVLSPARSCNEYYNSEKTQGPPAFSGFPASARTTGHRLPTAACRLYLAFLTCPVTARLTTGLSVPMGATIFVGLLWTKSTTKAAVTAVAAGFAVGLVCFLDQTLRWSLAVLSHPYMHSFLHRAPLVWVITALVMIGVSLMSERPDPEKVRENMFRCLDQSWTGISDYRIWAALLLLCTIGLWWSFR